MLKFALPTNALTALETIEVGNGFIIPCDDRCMFAKGDDCDCECGGKNHQQGGKLTTVQMYRSRTDAGRIIKTMVPNSSEWKQAEGWLRLRDEEGMTQKDIAAEAGVSGPTVRRAIRRLVYTLAIAEAQAAHQH